VLRELDALGRRPVRPQAGDTPDAAT
jgi:hypothetical protein